MPFAELPPPPPADELARRHEAVRAALRDRGLDGLLLVAARDILYLSGCAQDAHLVFPVDGEPALLVRRDVERAQRESALERIEPLRSLRALPSALAACGLRGRVRLGLELDVLPAASYLRYRELMPNAQLVDGMPALWAARSIKGEWEVERVLRASRQAAAAFDAAPRLLQPGTRECDALSSLVHVMRLAGHEGTLPFRGLNGDVFGEVLGGESAAVRGPTATPLCGPGLSSAQGRGPGRRRLRAGDAVVVDLSGLAEGYVSDQTRTYFLGAPDERLRAAYEVCRTILAECVALLVPGTPAARLYERGLELASEAGLGDHFMGHGPGRVRFVGHGIGLEVNEPPFLSHGWPGELQAGNVVALEPKLVFPDLGAVGIENSYLVTEGVPQLLTEAPEEALELAA